MIGCVRIHRLDEDQAGLPRRGGGAADGRSGRTARGRVRHYIVFASDTDPDTVWVTEVWESKEKHDASLQLPETKAAIAKAMPMLTGEFTRQELFVVGGLGV